MQKLTSDFVCSRGLRLNIKQKGKSVLLHENNEKCYLPMTTNPTVSFASSYAPAVKVSKFNTSFQAASKLVSYLSNRVSENVESKKDVGRAVSLVHPSFTYSFWETTQPSTFRFDVLLYYTDSIYYNIIYPMLTLANYLLPAESRAVLNSEGTETTFKYGLHPPNDVDFDAVFESIIEQRNTAGGNTNNQDASAQAREETLTLEFGSYKLSEMILTSMDMTPSSEVVYIRRSSGLEEIVPIFLNVQLQAQSLFMPTTESLARNLNVAGLYDDPNVYRRPPRFYEIPKPNNGSTST